jgi:hypothetical protein
VDICNKKALLERTEQLRDAQREIRRLEALLPPPTPDMSAYPIYSITYYAFKTLLESKGIQIIELDGMALTPLFNYTVPEGWMDALGYLIIGSDLYRPNVFMCGEYALKAQNEAAEVFGLNALRTCIQHGEPAHAYDVFPVHYDSGPELWLFEPNEGFGFDLLLPFGAEGRQPDLALI